MRIKLVINEHTTDSELVHLGNFFSALGLNRGAHVISAPADDVEYTVIIPPANTTEQELRDGELGKTEGINILTGKPEPKRRRRTKEEIAAAQDSGAMFYWSHPESDSFGLVVGRAELDKVLASDPLTVEVTKEQYLALVEAKAKAETTAPVEPEVPTDPAPTPPVEPQDTPPSETASTEPASASPSSVPTPAELNTKAAAVAKKIGPEKIRDRIRELGGTLISTLSPDALIAFNDWLDQQ